MVTKQARETRMVIKTVEMKDSRSFRNATKKKDRERK